MASAYSAIQQATSGLLAAISPQPARSKASPLSAKDSLAPKKAATTIKKKKAHSSGKFAAVGPREMSKGLNLTLPLRVAHRSCQRYMPRASATSRNHIIYGRHAAVTAICSIEYVLEKIMRGAIRHAIRRDAKTVSLLDTQRSVITQPDLAYSLRHASVAVTNAPNPQGIVPGMTIGLRNKKRGAVAATTNRTEPSSGKKQSAAKQGGKKPSAKSSKKTQTKHVEKDQEVDEDISDNDERDDNEDDDEQSNDMETSNHPDNDDNDTSTDDNVEEHDLGDSAESFDGRSADDVDDVSL